MQAKVIEALPNYLYRVEASSGDVFVAHIATKMKLINVRLERGDSVKIEVSEFNNEKARIIKKI